MNIVERIAAIFLAMVLTTTVAWAQKVKHVEATSRLSVAMSICRSPNRNQ